MSDLLPIPRWLFDPQKKLDLGCAECTCTEESNLCDACWERTRAEHAYLRNVPRHQIYMDAQAEQERNDELRSAGRGHLVRS